MATPTKLDIQAVKDAMAKTPGLNYVDAARQVRGVQNAPVATTPTTPIVPTPVPTSPLIPTPTVQPITNQEVQQGVNAVGGTAEQRRQTRTDITAGQTVVSPTPVEPVSPTPVSTTPTEKTPGITQDAFQQAKIESEKIKAQNDAVMAQNKQKSELARQDEAMKAEALMPKDEKSVLNALISGIGVPKQNTQAYRNAEVKSNNYRKYASMTPTQLLDNMKMGQISTEMDQLLASNPNYAQAKQKLNEFQKTQNLNKTMSNIVNGMKGKEVATVTPEQDEVSISDQLMKKYGLDDANVSAFAQFVATDEEMADNKAKLLANKNALSSVNRQINETTTLLNQGIKDLKAQYPDMPASGIITLMGSRLSEFNDAITNLNSTRSLLTADIKDEMDLAKSAFDAKSADILAGKELRQSMALNEYKSDFEKQQAQEALNDPATQIGATIKQFADLGIIADKNTAWHVAEQNRLGMSLNDYTKKMIEDFKAKPEYKQILAKKANEGVSFQTIGDKVYKVQNGQLVDTGISATKSSQPVWQEWEDASGKHAGWVTPGVNPTVSTGTKPTGNIVQVSAGNKTVRLDQVGAIGFENAINQLKSAGLSVVVGQGARDQTATIKSMAEQFGIPFNASNPAETAQKLRNAGHQVADPGKSNHESGMAIDVYGNSKLDAVTPEQERILNANGWYSAGIPGDAGHFEYRGGGTGTQATGEYTDQNINDLAYLVELQEKNPTQAAKDMKELGYNARDLANYKAGNVPMTEKQKNSSIEVMNAIKDLADPSKYEWNDAVGFLAGTPSLSGGDAANATMAIDNLVAKLTLPNLGVLKGPMSDKDIQFIKEASSKLSRNQSDASFERNLIDAYNLSARRAGKPEITKLSDISTGTKSGTVGGELDYSKYE